MLKTCYVKVLSVVQQDRKESLCRIPNSVTQYPKKNKLLVLFRALFGT